MNAQEKLTNPSYREVARQAVDMVELPDHRQEEPLIAHVDRRGWWTVLQSHHRAKLRQPGRDTC